jgi:hypothetical protein
MKFRVTPLLEGSTAANEAAAFSSELSPRTFVDWMDRFKALYFEAAAPGDDNGDGDDDDDDDDDAIELLTTEDFGQFVVDLKLQYYPYLGGAAPRTVIPCQAGKDILFTANERYGWMDGCTYVYILLVVLPARACVCVCVRVYV